MKANSQPRTGLSSGQKRDLLVEVLDHEASHIRLFPLSLAQQRLWFVEQLEPGSPAHNISSGLRLNGTLDAQALQRSVSEIVARHDTLRTSFLTPRGEVLQRISGVGDVVIPIVDLGGLPDATREQEAYLTATEEAQKPFDLECSPLLRLLLIRLSDEQHILVFTMHHLVADGWSIGVFVEELIELYDAEVYHRKSLLPPVSIQYVDYAVWQRESLDDEALVKQAQYWKKRLAGADSLLELPADRVRPAEQSFLGATVSVPAPASLIESLRILARAEGTTLFTVLLAAFNILLHRYSNQDDVRIGVPVAGRGILETEDLIGLFVNTLVIRTDLSGNPKFRTLLAEVRDTSIDAHANQDLPFEEVVEQLQPERSLSHNPIFQVMMSAIKEPLSNRCFATLSASQYPLGSSSSMFDLTAFVVEAADGSFWWRFQYSTALFDWARIQRMIGHYQTLLASIVEKPYRRIADLELLTSGEAEQFAAWNGIVADYPKRCVHTLVADQAKRTPDRIAVVFGEEQLTYAELHHRATRVAAALQADGAGTGSLVAVFLNRSLDLIVGVLGILYSGAAYVPLDPADPAARLSIKLEESGVDLVLTQRSLLSRLPRNNSKRVLTEDAVDASPGNVVEPQDPENIAYVIFTSGSTGKPKGVCVPHRALVNLLSSMQDQPGLSSSDRLLAVTSLSFDISALELFLPLTTGAQLVIASSETVVDGTMLLESLRRYGITVMQATPSTWRMLIDAGWNPKSSNLKVLCGGEALPVVLANELTERSDSVWNLYGPTETTVWSSVSFVRAHSPVTIGHPIRNTQFYVLDRRMRRVPIGVPGELYIGGEGLAVGYLNRPDLTAERFISNPFNSNGGRLYKTGDEVRYRADGEIEYLGRLDWQVKVRGHRIELGELEFVAMQQPGVLQARAVVREDTPGDQRLVCYVVPERGALLRPEALIALMKNILPYFMIPSIVVLESLPLSQSGKVDHIALPAPSKDSTVGFAPRNDVEARLLRIWQQILHLSDIGVTANFFDLGGHSLLALQLLSEIDRVFGRRLPVAAVFRAQTIEQMAAILTKPVTSPYPLAATLQPEGRRPPLFVVPGAYGYGLPHAVFARRFGSDQPVHFLHSVGLEGERTPLERIEEIAEYFVDEIRKIQPSGPYCLAGFCVGGIIAFEIAQQLIATGEEPPFLALIETWHPRSVPVIRAPPAALRPLAFLARGVGRHLRGTFTLPPGQAIRYFREKSAIIKEMALRRDIYRRDPSKRYLPLVFEANYRAASQYAPRPYPGHLSLFLAGNLQIAPDLDTRLVWCELAQGGSHVVRTAAANFGDLLKEPCVSDLADSLDERLRGSSRQTALSQKVGLVS